MTNNILRPTTFFDKQHLLYIRTILLFFKQNMTTRSRQGSGVIHIDLTLIKSYSTCDSLLFPRGLCCGVCQPLWDAAHNMSKKSSVGKKRFRDYHSDRWRCQQPWLSKYGQSTASQGKMRLFYRVRNYLGIETALVLDHCCVYPRQRNSDDFFLQHPQMSQPSRHQQVIIILIRMS